MAIAYVASPIAQGPAVSSFAVTPSDATIFSPATRKLWIGGAGNVAVLLAGDTVPVTLLAVPVGTMLEVAVTKLMSANTTATAIIGFR